MDEPLPPMLDEPLEPMLDPELVRQNTVRAAACTTTRATSALGKGGARKCKHENRSYCHVFVDFTVNSWVADPHQQSLRTDVPHPNNKATPHFSNDTPDVRFLEHGQTGLLAALTAWSRAESCGYSPPIK